MDYGLFDFLTLIGSLGLFIYGMKIMSEGLQKIAGSRLKGILRGMTSNRVSGVITGFLTTALIQSSSATTVMVVSFVNAGLLTLAESMGVIMGANVGTTITGLLISVLGFKVKITAVAKVMIGLSFPLLFSSKTSLRSFAEFVLGFGILFIGLDFLKGSVPDIKGNPQLLEFLSGWTSYGYFSIILFVLIGTVLTVVIQSSSATMAVTFVMVNEGWIPFEYAAAMILGENIGTTITANLAAMVGNVHAKRSARFHFLFNMIGVVWVLLVFKFFIQGVDAALIKILPDYTTAFATTPEGRVNATFALSIFHASFNLANVFLLIGFAPYLGKLVIWMQPSKGEADEELSLKFINTGLMATPDLSLANAKLELENFSKVVEKMGRMTATLLFEDKKKYKKLIEKIRKREEVTDDMELEISDYLGKVSESELSHAQSETIRSIHEVSSNLENIADVFNSMTRTFERITKLEQGFPDEAKTEIKSLMDLVQQSMKLTQKNINKPWAELNIEEVYELEKEINQLRTRLSKAHQKRLEKGIYTPRAGMSYIELIQQAEKVGDYLLDINEALIGLY